MSGRRALFLELVEGFFVGIILLGELSFVQIVGGIAIA